jgi:hypothetical protein
MLMTISELTFIILGLNSLVDQGHHVGVTIDEVETAIERGTLFAWLGKKFAGRIRSQHP